MAALLSAFALGATGLVSAAKAEAITLRIATGQPPGAIHAGRIKNFFEPELKKRVESRTAHTATQA